MERCNGLRFRRERQLAEWGGFQSIVSLTRALLYNAPMRATAGTLAIAILAVVIGQPAAAMPAGSNPWDGADQSDASQAKSDLNSKDVFCRHFYAPRDKPPDCDLTKLRSKQVIPLVAIVPDPYRTDLRLHFDRSLDALLWAVGDSGYSYERRWFPWSASGDNERLPKGAGEQPALHRVKGEPGLLLFHGERNWDRVLALFLVGESITGGLDRPAFDKALSYIGDLAADSSPEVFIVGPTFSGTLSSLARAIFEAGEKYRYRIVSGTVTDYGSQRVFHEQLAGLFQSARVTFGAMVEDDSFAAHAFLDYLQRQWADRGEIALLAEDQTAYGAVADKIPHENQGLNEKWLVMRFPYGVSRLRNSYEQETSAATLTNESSTAARQPPPQTLAFDIGTPDERDAVPAFSRVQTPISQEAMLFNIASTLQRERVTYVGIMATDILDAVFLTRFLRKTAPDARIFLLDSDLLFARAELNVALEGILNVTTYPLFVRNQHWTETELKGKLPRRTAFPNRYSEGEYNAARKQLYEMKAIGDAQRTSETLLDYRSPVFRGGGDNRPPLWLTVLGRDGFWPVALLDDAFIKGEKAPVSSLLPGTPMATLNEELHPDPPSHIWLFILGFLTIAGLLHAGFVALVYLSPSPPSWMPAAMQTVRTAISESLYKIFAAYPRATVGSANVSTADGRDSEAFQCSTALLIATLILGCAEVVAGASALPYLRGPGRSGLVYLIPPLLATVFLVAAAVRILIRPEPRPVLRWTALAAFAAFLILWRLSFAEPGDPTFRAFFFAYRLSHPGSAVCPALPVLLLLGALFGWALMLMARRAGVEPPQIPALDDQKRLAGILDRGLTRPISTWTLLLGIAVILAWSSTLGHYSLERLRSVENRWFDILVFLLLTFTYGLLFAAWGQLLSAWRNFRRFLESLARHPVQPAFARLPKVHATLPLFQKEPQKLDLSASARAVHTVYALLGQPGSAAIPAEVAARAAGSRYWLNLAESKLARGLREKPAAYSEVSAVSHQLEQSVLETANGLVSWSEDRFWSNEGFGCPRTHDAEDGELEIAAGEEQRKLAEEFVALRLLMYIRHVLREMRSLLWFIVADFVLVVLALSSYPFQSSRLVSVLCVGSLVILGSAISMMFAQMERDAVLSELSTGTPNEIGRPFYMRLVSFGTLPLITVLATQFPAISGLLSQWVQPAIEALR